jgi:hypothetical protein
VKDREQQVGAGAALPFKNSLLKANVVAKFIWQIEMQTIGEKGNS